MAAQRFMHVTWFMFCFQAEARLAVRRQARAEAREIRMRELERQQREAEENADRVYDMHPGTSFAPVYFIYFLIHKFFIFFY